MNAEAFTLKARRTTRVPLRVPLKIGVETAGQSGEMDGWTIIVNIHGAKIECKRHVALGDTVKVTVSPTRKSQSGKVVWSNQTANAAGNYEFAVELTEPGNLWGVGFPPSDWKEVRQNSGPVAVESKAAASDEGQPARSNTATTSPAEVAAGAAAPRKISVVGYELKPIVPFAIAKGGTAELPSDAPSDAQNHTPVAVADLAAPQQIETPVACETAVAVKAAAVELAIPDLPLMAEPYQPEADVNCPDAAGEPAVGHAGTESLDMNAAQNETIVRASDEATSASSPIAIEQLFPTPEDATSLDTQRREAEPLAFRGDAVSENTALVAQEIALSQTEPMIVEEQADSPVSIESVPLLEMLSSLPHSALEDASCVRATPEAAPAQADVKSITVLNEKAEAALQARIEAMIERSTARLEAALADIEAATIERVDKKLGGASEDHYERLDQHSDALVAARRLEFEQALTSFSEAADEAARNRQQEIVSRTDQDLRRRAGDLTLYTEGQLKRHAAEAAENAQSAMAKQLQDLLGSIEEDVDKKCRIHAEQAHVISRAHFEGMLSSRIEEARAYWQGQLDEMQAAASTSVNASVEDYMEMQSKKLMQQMDQALAQMAGQIQRTFFKHVVAELSSQQQVWMAQLRSEMGKLSDQGVVQIRRQLAALLGAMGSAVLRNVPEAHSGSAPSLVDQTIAEHFVNAEA